MPETAEQYRKRKKLGMRKQRERDNAICLELYGLTFTQIKRAIVERRGDYVPMAEVADGE